MLSVASADGVDLALHDLGGEGAPLLLVHGTGFCGAVHEPLAAALVDHHCWALDLRGHGASSSPAPAAGGAGWGWDRLAADAAAAARAVADCSPATTEGLVAFGHSSGAAALLGAEADRPGTFAALWCYEPIVWPDPVAARPRAARLAEGAARRRTTFASAGDALANFVAKPPFAWFDRACLEAYVRCGFEAAGDDGSVRLRCDPAAEAAIYLAATEGDRFARLGDVGCPVVVAHGEHTDAVGAALAGQIAAALPRARSRALPGLRHFGPLEAPGPVAATVAADLARG